ncbi:hypothetical protein [Caloranaerobacter sp. DY30410]|uniref:DUF6848 family protein n=1 Tax=Caloranaerobacter sp. DY30410 TaxID=3238305 RepID=UPI003D02F7D1
MDKNKIQELKSKYEKIYIITTTIVDEDGEDKEIEFIFRKPDVRDYDRFIKDASKKPSQAFKNLVLSGVIDEDRDRLKKTLEDFPAAASSIAKEYLRLMGLSDTTNLRIL